MTKSFVIQELIKRDEEGKPVHRTVEVPDGMWVTSAGTHYRREEEWDEEGELTYSESEETVFEVVGGVQPVRHVTDRSGGSNQHRGSSSSWSSSLSQLVVDRPFGVVYVEKDNGEPSPYHSFRAARQVHKGELGRGLEFPRPRFAREASPHMIEGHVSHVTDKPVRKRDVRRGRHAWACLAETAALANLSPEEFVRRFYAFADDKGHGLPAILDSAREDIHGRESVHTFVKRFCERDLPALFDRDPSRVWLRRGFVLAALSLYHLGYEPNAASKVA